MAGLAKGAAVALALAVLGGCASLVGTTESVVLIRTNPDGAQCEVKGREGFAAVVQTPATVTLPTDQSPMTVTCSAPGFRPTSHTLTAGRDGWIWGNSAFIMATGGVAVLGALVDESRGAGRTYQAEALFDLDKDRPRPILARDRAGTELRLQAR